MSDDHNDERSEERDLLREIGADLNIDPSPAFAARVRVAVDAEGAPGRAGRWRAWIWTGAAMAGACAVAVIAVSRAREVPSAPAATQVGAVVPVVVPPPAPAPVTRTMPEPPAAAIGRAPRQPEAPGPVVATASSRRPDMSVVTDQPDLLRRLWANVPVGSIDPVAADRSFREALVAMTAPPLPVTELVVEPIPVKPLETPDGVGGGRPGGVRLTADAITRSE